MHKGLITFCLFTILSLSCFGCTGITKDSSKGTMIKCPKCGAFYSSKEGAETFEWMRGGLKDSRK